MPTAEYNFFLDADKSRSIFALLFTFLKDEAFDSEENCSYEDTMSEILMGASLPVGAYEKLRAVYNVIQSSSQYFSTHVSIVESEFRDNRNVLILVVKILLRLANDSGYICRLDKERLLESLTCFDFANLEYEQFSEIESRLLSYVLDNDMLNIQGLNSSYGILGCEPTVTDRELRQAYRKLAKKYHPDRTTVEKHSEATIPQRRARFEEIQLAYESIKKRRALA